MANVTTIYAGTQDGLAIFNKPGTLNEWLPPRRVLAGLPVPSVWAEVGPPVRVVALQGGNLRVSDNGGRAWEQVATEQPASAIFPGHSERELFVALRGGGLLASEDAGASWRELPSLPGEAVAMLAVGDSDAGSRHVFVLGGNAVYRGDLREGTWRTLLGHRLSTLAYDQETGRLFGAAADRLLESSDHGETWTTIPGSPSGSVALVSVPGAAGKPPALVAGTAHGITSSPDGGETWQQADVNGSITALQRDPERRDRLYAGTAEGILFESGNRGQAWTQVNALPVASVISVFLVRI